MPSYDYWAIGHGLEFSVHGGFRFRVRLHVLVVLLWVEFLKKQRVTAENPLAKVPRMCKFVPSSEVM